MSYETCLCFFPTSTSHNHCSGWSIGFLGDGDFRSYDISYIVRTETYVSTQLLKKSVFTSLLTFGLTIHIRLRGQLDCLSLHPLSPSQVGDSFRVPDRGPLSIVCVSGNVPFDSQDCLSVREVPWCRSPFPGCVPLPLRVNRIRLQVH